MFSGTAEYALRAVVYLAERHGEGPVGVKYIAEALELPANYLSKVFHELARAGILHSVRGKTGGFTLAVPPEELTLFAIVSRFDTVGERQKCLLGRATCADDHPCPAHHRWKPLGTQISAFLRETTIADLVTRSDASAA